LVALNIKVQPIYTGAERHDEVGSHMHTKKRHISKGKDVGFELMFGLTVCYDVFSQSGVPMGI